MSHAPYPPPPSTLPFHGYATLAGTTVRLIGLKFSAYDTRVMIVTADGTIDSVDPAHLTDVQVTQP